MTTRALPRAILAVGVVMAFVRPATGQTTPVRTPCDVPAATASATATIDSLETALRNRKWDYLDRELGEIRSRMVASMTCGDQKAASNGNYAFIWEGEGHVPRHYLLESTIARRPRAYMRTNTAESSWYEVVLASNEADAARISTSWSAAPAAVSGQDLSAWLQSLLPAVIGAAAILVPPVPKPILQEFEQPQTSQLFIRASYLATDIVPAKVADTTTVIAPARSLRTPEMKARVAEWQMSMLPYAVRDVPRQFVTDVVKALETISCNDSVACAKQSLTQIDAIASNDKCNPPDPDCIAVTNSARQWAANLARVDNQIRQVAFSSEPPKHWAVGPYAGAAKYPQSVARGEAVRVRVGGDSRLQADQFGRGVAGFIAAVALRPHQPDYWSLKNLGVHAGAIITPNIGVTVGMQWRVFRQVAIIGGPIWVWYPSGTVNSVISTSNPLKRERLQAWTFGAAFMSDAR